MRVLRISRARHAALAIPLDHIVAGQHSGSSDQTNLAWACQRCSLGELGVLAVQVHSLMAAHSRAG